MIFYRPSFIGGKMKIYDRKATSDGGVAEAVLVVRPSDNGKDIEIEDEVYAKSRCPYLYTESEYTTLKAEESYKEEKRKHYLAQGAAVEDLKARAKEEKDPKKKKEIEDKIHASDK